MKAGDIIVEFDGEPVTDSTALIVDIRSHKPGDKVKLTVQRGSGTEDLTITLGSRFLVRLTRVPWDSCPTSVLARSW